MLRKVVSNLISSKNNKRQLRCKWKQGKMIDDNGNENDCHDDDEDNNNILDSYDEDYENSHFAACAI